MRRFIVPIGMYAAGFLWALIVNPMPAPVNAAPAPVKPFTIEIRESCYFTFNGQDYALKRLTLDDLKREIEE